MNPSKLPACVASYWKMANFQHFNKLLGLGLESLSFPTATVVPQLLPLQLSPLVVEPHIFLSTRKDWVKLSGTAEKTGFLDAVLKIDSDSKMKNRQRC